MVASLARSQEAARFEYVVVLEKSPTVFLVALFIRGFWLEITLEEERTKARYLYTNHVIGNLRVGLA